MYTKNFQFMTFASRDVVAKGRCENFWLKNFEKNVIMQDFPEKKRPHGDFHPEAGFFFLAWLKSVFQWNSFQSQCPTSIV